MTLYGLVWVFCAHWTECSNILSVLESIHITSIGTGLGPRWCQMNKWCVINIPDLQGKVVPTVSTLKWPLLRPDGHHSISSTQRACLHKDVGVGTLVWKWLVSVQKQKGSNFPREPFERFSMYFEFFFRPITKRKYNNSHYVGVCILTKSKGQS